MIRNSIDFQGHQDQSIRIHKNLGPYCQMLLFSATYDQVSIFSPHFLSPSSNCAGSDGFCREHCVQSGDHQAEEGGGEFGQYQTGAE